MKSLAAFCLFFLKEHSLSSGAPAAPCPPPPATRRLRTSDFGETWAVPLVPLGVASLTCLAPVLVPCMQPSDSHVATQHACLPADAPILHATGVSLSSGGSRRVSARHLHMALPGCCSNPMLHAETGKRPTDTPPALDDITGPCVQVHYRAAPDIRGSGKERGHGIELQECPLCHVKLQPRRHHVGCSALKGAAGSRRARQAGPPACAGAAACQCRRPIPLQTPLPHNLCRQTRQQPHLLKQLQRWTSQSIRRMPL